MLSFNKSSLEGRHQTIETEVERPATLGREELAGEVGEAVTA
jgi:hypothetical protein